VRPQLAVGAADRDAAPGAPRRPGSRTRGAPGRGRLGLWVLLAPYLLGTAALVGLPGVLALALAFARYDALSAPSWVGLANFRAVAEDPLFWIAARNSLLFVVLTVPLRLLGALTLALLLARRRRGSGLYRAAVYLPTVIPEVPYALLWLWIVNPVYGPLNLMLGSLGLPTPAWLVHGDTALAVMVVIAAFQLGEGFVVLLAGLQDVPDELYAVAAIDGAGPWRSFASVTLPLLAPWLVLVTLRDIMVSAHATFAPAYLMTGGGPDYATLFLPLHIYNVAFGALGFGSATAMTLLLLLGTGSLLLLVYHAVGGWGYDDDV
jgi:multiple sugar transport system permease protein